MTLPGGVTSIGGAAFRGCENLTQMTLPSGLASIGQYAFYNCASLALTALPSSLTLIEQAAFYGCRSLALTALPDSLTSIAPALFYGCAGLTQMTLPSGLSSISNLAFYGCASLATVAMPSALPAISADAFTGTSGNMVFLAPDHPSYASWMPSGTKIVTADGSMALTGSAAIPIGGTISLSCVQITGASYQWEREASPGIWTPVSGSAGGSYSKSNATVTDSGSYRASIAFGLISPFRTAAMSVVVTGDSLYTVTFDSQGGSAVAPVTALPGTTITAPLVPMRSGYPFGGWYKEAACANAWDFAADTVTADITLYAKWNAGAPAAPGAVESIRIGDFPLRLAPGESFDVSLDYAATGGGAPNPAPVLSASAYSEGAALAVVEILSSDSVRVTALPQDSYISRGAPGSSAIYGETRIEFITSQTFADGSTFRQSAVKTLVIADDLATSIGVTQGVIDEFSDANEALAASGEMILPGNTQQPITSLNADWYLIEELDNARIAIEHPVWDVLPECFEPAGRDAANIDIDVSRLVPPGMKALLPLTFRVTARRSDLDIIFGDSFIVGQILASPLDCLDEIFSRMVIQKEILEGERAGWYTRLVSGVLTPQDAVDKGILEITGGDALTLTLSYYVLDDSSKLEAFESGGYLIVPDGDNNNEIVDPIWLNMWRPGYAPGGNTMQGAGASSGGGCSGWNGAAFLAVIVLLAFMALKRGISCVRG
jgi:uncharacterized repeat protein (TIGR02543 family)